MGKKPNILVVGSFVMDLIVSTQRLPENGETVLGTGFRTAPGGKGLNQAVQAARLGAQVEMMGCVGRDAYGDAMLACAREAMCSCSSGATAAPKTASWWSPGPTCC